LPYVNAFDLFLKIIEASVAVSAVTAVFLVVSIIVLRTRNAITRRNQEILTTRWRHIFKTPYTGEVPPDPLPGIGKRDWFTVLCLFLRFHEIREKDLPRAEEIFLKLDDMAYRLGIDEYALLLLEKGDGADKILALEILGHLRERRALPGAIALSSHDGPELSRSAAQCALRIDPRYIEGVLGLVGEREDWVRSRIESMLKEVDPEILDSAMQKAIHGADDAPKRRLLDYLRFCRPYTAHLVCRKILAESRDFETLAAALRSLAPHANSSDRRTALRFCNHESPIVLLSALRVLRKCVQYEDRELLERLTAHQDYWVRLRAAEAVVQLYGESGLTQDFLSGLTDRYARDAIKQALSESKLWARRRKAADRRGVGVPLPQPT
jgi:HEAT repeat protein